MTARELYAEMVAFLTERGWKRTDPGDGWWWHENFAGEMVIGEAVSEQIADEGVDLRIDPPADALRDQAVFLARGEFQPDMQAAKDALLAETAGVGESRRVDRLDRTHAVREQSLSDRDDHRGEW
jgi:hypothetical protein